MKQSVLERISQMALIEIARDREILLFSDEVYRGMEYDGSARLPHACDLYENAVSLNVTSKAFGLAGLRIGWAASRNRQVLQRMFEIKDYTTICNAAPSEFLAAVALRARDRILNRNRGIVLSNLPKLEAFFAARGDLFSWVPPAAGPVTFPTLLSDTGVEAFCQDVLEQSGVLLVPGTVFDPESHEVRFGFGRRSFPDALTRLEAYLSRQGES